MTTPLAILCALFFTAVLWGVRRLYLLHQAEEALKSEAQKAQDFEDQQW